MQTAADQRRIHELTVHIMVGMKRSSKLMMELSRVAQQYAQLHNSLSETGLLLASLIGSVAHAQGQADLEQGILSVAEAVRMIERTRQKCAKTVLNNFVAPIVKQDEDQKREIPAFEKRMRAEQKAADAEVKRAERIAKKATRRKKKGGPDDLQTHIQRIDERVHEAQRVSQEHLRTAALMERSKYCAFLRCGMLMLKAHAATSSTTEQQLGGCMPTLGRLVGAINEIPSDVQSLVNLRKRTLLDIGNLSADWKRIFRDAGVSMADLEDEATARLLLATIEKAAVQQGVAPPPSLSLLTSALAAEDAQIIEDDGATCNAEPPEHRPGPASRPIPTEADDTSGSSAPPLPPRSPRPSPRGPPPPTPPRSPRSQTRAVTSCNDSQNGATTSAPTSALLTQIQGRTAVLRPAQQRQQHEPAQLPDLKNFRDTGDLTSILRAAMSSRRPAMRKEDDDDNEEQCNSARTRRKGRRETRRVAHQHDRSEATHAMRAIVRTEGSDDARFYVLRTCERRSDPPPLHVLRSMLSARLYHAEGLEELERRRLLFRRDISGACGGCESWVIFVSCDAHTRLGGAEAGFLKTFKRRTRTSFVHQSEVMAKSEFWDEQLRWLSQQLGTVVSFEHRQRRGERIPLLGFGAPGATAAAGSEDTSAALAAIMSRIRPMLPAQPGQTPSLLQVQQQKLLQQQPQQQQLAVTGSPRSIQSSPASTAVSLPVPVAVPPVICPQFVAPSAFGPLAMQTPGFSGLPVMPPVAPQAYQRVAMAMSDRVLPLPCVPLQMSSMAPLAHPMSPLAMAPLGMSPPGGLSARAPVASSLQSVMPGGADVVLPSKFALSPSDEDFASILARMQPPRPLARD
eukprot:m51a1_g14638 putative arp2 3 complex-activating protein (853) ;mRNA; f:45212-51554